jgi:hypothetical protein
VLHPPSDEPVPLDIENESDAAVIRQMYEVLGDFFTEKLQGDSSWARGVLGVQGSK